MKRPSECRGCPFYNEREEFVPFVGPTDAKLALIGESPGDDEVAAGEPFVGRSGYQVNAALRHHEIDRSKVLIGNTILCRPPRQYDENDKEWARAIAHCAARVSGPVVDAVKPEAVVTFGGPAMMRHTGFRGVDSRWGSSWKASEIEAGGPIPVGVGAFVRPPKWGGGDPWIVPCIHPAFVLRGNQHLKPLLAHCVGRGWRHANGRARGPKPETDRIALRSQAEEALKLSSEIVFDIETVDDRPTMIGVADEHGIIRVMDPTDSLRKFLAESRALKVGHNIYGYDIKCLGGVESVGQPWFDTILAAALVQPALPRSLPEVTALYGGDFYAYWKDLTDNPRTEAALRRRYGLTWDVPLDRFYNALDVFWTRVDKGELVEEMRYYGVLDLFWNTQMALAPELIELEKRGMPVDEAKMRRKRVEAKLECRRIRRGICRAVELRAGIRLELARSVEADGRERLRRQVESVGTPCGIHPEFDGRTRRTKCGACNALWTERRQALRGNRKGYDRARSRAKRFEKSPFDPDSDLDWRWLIYGPKEEGAFGLKGGMRTKQRGTASLNKDALRGLLAQAGLPDEAREFITGRYRLGQLRSRISKYLSLPVEADGRVHPSYALHIALNGRLSSGLDDTDEDKPSSPYSVNAQNFPEDCRDVIAAPSGWALVNFDYSAIEDWTTAMDVWKETGSRAYWDFLKATKDVHSYTRDYLNSHWKGVEVNRKQAKTGRHGWKYGMQWKKLAMTRAGDGITPAIAKTIIATLDDMHPDVVEWRKRKIAAVRRHPTLRQPFTRICHFTLTRARSGEGVTPDEPNEVVSWWPSSVASDIAKKAWLRLRAAGMTGRLINHSHDSFLFCMPEGEVNEFVPGARKLLEAPVEVLRGWNPDGEAFVPKGEVMIGRNWREAGEDNPEGLKCH